MSAAAMPFASVSSRSAGLPSDQLADGRLSEELVKALEKPFPPEAIRFHKKTGLASIGSMWVVERLNQVFGLNGWTASYEILESDPSIVVRCRLAIPAYAVAREQFGGNEQADRGDAYKSACTDALGKCASQVGVGAMVYKGLVRQTSASSWFFEMRRILGPGFEATLRKHNIQHVTREADTPAGRACFQELIASFRKDYAWLRGQLGDGEFRRVLDELQVGGEPARLSLAQQVQTYWRMETKFFGIR